MAYIDEDSEDSEKYADFYNVSYAVGMGCPNWTEDVMMVQFFLQRIYLDEEWKPLTPRGVMKVDGLCGAITRHWIAKFQADARNDGHHIHVDGIVDNASNPANNQQTSITKTHYTVRSMNNFLRNTNKPLYSTLPFNQEVPPLLRLAFLQMHAEKPDADFNF